jgi:hypothetical protein
VATYAQVDVQGDIQSGSLAFGVDGLPIIGYYDNTNFDLKVVHCGNAGCTAGNTITALDTEGIVGTFASLAIGADDLAIISYHDSADDDVKVAHCANVACTAADAISAVDASDIVGEFSSLTIGADDLPLVAYFDFTNGDLKVAHCGNVICTAGNTVTVVDAPGTVGRCTALAIGADGLPIISYYDGTNRDLKVAHCGDLACASGNTLTTVDAADTVGEYSSVAIGLDGLPVISYRDQTNLSLKVAHCGNAECSAGNSIVTVDDGGMGASTSDIEVAADGMPIISYWNSQNMDLRVAHCGNLTCSSGNTITTADGTGMMGQGASMEIGPHGRPVISSYNGNTFDLRVARCTNHLCTGAPDTDLDGCSNAQEAGPDASLGGGRSGKVFWDFYDTPDELGERDLAVTSGDLGRVVARFGSAGEAAGDPLMSAPLAPAYHTAFDRTGPAQADDPWDLREPDGSVTAADIASLVAQFGHTCA